METVYFVSASIGGAILVIQTLLALFGSAHAEIPADAHVEFDVAHDLNAADSFLKILSFKALVGFATFFGLAGLAADRAGFDRLPTALVALGAGIAALYAIAWMMAGLSQLRAEGTVDLANAVGTTAKVYLRVPAHGAGHGKVTVAVQGRTLETKAVTTGSELPAGTIVRVVRAPGPDLVEVVAKES